MNCTYIKTVLCFIVGVFCIFPAVAFSQGGGESLTLEDLQKYMNEFYAAIVIIWGYLARWLKVKKSPMPFVFVVVAGGLVIGWAFVAFGGAQVKPLIISFLASLGTYSAVLRPIENSAKAVSNEESRGETIQAWKALLNDPTPDSLKGFKEYFQNKN